MCGIAGFNWRDPDRIRVMTNALSHRGPDDEGVFVDSAVSLGHRRLSILDLSSAGHQPMFYDRKHGASSASWKPDLQNESELSIVYNGEIYNFMEIRQELEALEYVFSTHCDSEVILAAYQHWGEHCVERFNGMWAFCIYDRSAQSLFLSRDRMGIKPLYIYERDGRFVFGSELKVFSDTLERREVDPVSLRHYFAFGFTPPSRTMLADVHKVLPGESLFFNLATCRIEKKHMHWSLPWSSNDECQENGVAQLRKTLHDAVKNRLVSDVPVGAFLSGGLDSSIIVSLMRPYVQDLKTFSVRFDHADFDESPWARCVSSHFRTDHHEVPFGAGDIRELMTSLPGYYDDPLGDASMIPTYLVSKVAREHVAVALSGTGADELFAGYPRYRELLLLRRLLKLPKSARFLLAKAYEKVDSDRGRKLMGLLTSPNPEHLYARLFSGSFRSHGGDPADFTQFPHFLPCSAAGTGLNAMLDVDQRNYLPDCLLVKEDRASMAHGLEIRVPFLDHNLVTFANGLASSSKLRGKAGKRLLRDAFRADLPSGVLSRRKQGFGVPLAHYFRGELKEFAYEIVCAGNRLSCVDSRDVQAIWDSHQSGKADNTHYLWCLIQFTQWYVRWIA
jgi:asparagine synthase (glutamine-hydrolysing)